MNRSHLVIFGSIYLSIILHSLLGAGIYFFPKDWMPSSQAHKPIEVEILAPQKNDDTKTIVREALIPENYKTPVDDNPARFLSAQKIRVKKEVRSSRNGMTQNSFNKAKKPKIEMPNKALKDFDGTDTTLARLKEMNSAQKPSTTGESLPVDISVGSFTALNTDQHFAYSFFSRVEELVRFRWETRIRNTMDSFHPDFLKQNSYRRNWITQVEFILAPNGQLLKGMVMKASGIKPFDYAAIDAFREAGFFPNPPKELVEEDGYIHLKYSFNVYSLPSPLTSR